MSATILALFFSLMTPRPRIEPYVRVMIAGYVTVRSSEDSARTAVSITGGRTYRDDVLTRENAFLFCIQHNHTPPQQFNFEGRARVVYRVRRDSPSAATRPGPERIVPAFGVLPVDIESWFFLAEGQTYSHPPTERSMGRFVTVKVADVFRQDYVGREGKRRGGDAATCLAAK